MDVVTLRWNSKNRNLWNDADSDVAESKSSSSNSDTDRDEILDSYESFSKENTPDLSFFPLANLTFDESTGIMNIGSEN